MDTNHEMAHHTTKLQKAVYYLLVCIIMGTGIFFLVEGLFQFLE